MLCPHTLRGVEMGAALTLVPSFGGGSGGGRRRRQRAQCRSNLKARRDRVLIFRLSRWKELLPRECTPGRGYLPGAVKSLNAPEALRGGADGAPRPGEAGAPEALTAACVCVCVCVTSVWAERELGHHHQHLRRRAPSKSAARARRRAFFVGSEGEARHTHTKKPSKLTRTMRCFRALL